MTGTLLHLIASFLVVYDIKCIIEFLLDFTENTTDGVLNNVGLNL